MQDQFLMAEDRKHLNKMLKINAKFKELASICDLKLESHPITTRRYNSTKRSFILSPTINTPVRLNSILFKPESITNIDNSQEDPTEYPEEIGNAEANQNNENFKPHDTVRLVDNPMHQTFGGEFAYPHLEPIKTSVKNSIVCQSFVVGDPRILKQPKINEENNPNVMDNIQKMLETQYGLKEQKVETKPRRVKKKDTSTVGIFSNLDGSKPAFDLENLNCPSPQETERVYIRVLHQVLSKMDNKYLMSKYRAFQRSQNLNKKN